MNDELKDLLKTVFDPMSDPDERAEAFKEAVYSCQGPEDEDEEAEDDMMDEDEDEEGPPPKGEGLALIFGGGPKRRRMKR